MSDPVAVDTPRLRLEPLRPETIEALLGRDAAAVAWAQGRVLPDAFFDPADDVFLAIQLKRMTARPGGRAWCARVIVRRDDGAVVGHCGFHGPPEDVGRAEIGYTVLAPYRRRGYATEAARSLIAWARSQGQAVVFASVAPDNAASLAVVEKLGFRQTGVQTDEIDGEEGVFELPL